MGAVDILLEMNEHHKDKTRRVITVHARVIQSDDLMFSWDKVTKEITIEGTPTDLSAIRVEQRILQNLRGPAWIKTVDIENGLQPKPSRVQVTKVLSDMAVRGLMERQPAMGEDVAGKTVKWRVVAHVEREKGLMVA